MAGGTVAVLEATGPGRLRAFPLKHTSIPERTCGPEEGAQKRTFHQLEQEQGTRPAPSAPLAHDRPRTFQNVACVCWVAYGMMDASMPFDVFHCASLHDCVRCDFWSKPTLGHTSVTF